MYAADYHHDNCCKKQYFRQNIFVKNSRYDRLLTRSDDLQILIAVTEYGGFSAAAEGLDIQVARISRAVRKLEQQLGVSILNRTTRRMELTEEGQLFVDAVRIGLQHIKQAEENLITRGKLPAGRLRVDAASPFVLHQLVPLIKPFKQQYPDIELELTSNEGFVDLLEKKTDIAIRIGKLNDSTLHARSLGKSSLFMLASPEYLKHRGTPETAADLDNHDLIGFSGNKILNHWPLPSHSFIEPATTSSNGEAVRQLALAGNGIACLSGFMVQQDIEEGTLIPVLEHEKLPTPGRESVNAVYYKSSSVARRISAFIDFIQPRLTLST